MPGREAEVKLDGNFQGVMAVEMGKDECCPSSTHRAPRHTSGQTVPLSTGHKVASFPAGYPEDILF